MLEKVRHFEFQENCETDRYFLFSIFTPLFLRKKHFFYTILNVCISHNIITNQLEMISNFFIRINESIVEPRYLKNLCANYVFQS